MHDAPGLVAKPRASDPPPPHSPYRRPVMERTGGSEAERASLRAAAQVEKGVITAKSSQSGARMKIATAPWPQFDQSHPPPKNGREEEDKYGNGPITDSPGSARSFGEPRRQRKEERCEEEEVHDASEYIERGHRRAPESCESKVRCIRRVVWSDRIV